MTEDAPEAPEAEEPPVQRPRVERKFERQPELLDLDVPDWEFIAKVVELFEPYADSEDEDTFTIHGSDSRGSYYAYDLAAFREEHDERGEELITYAIKAYGHDAHGFFMFTVFYGRNYGRGHADIEGANEIVVNGLAARIEQLGKEAAARRKARVKAKEPPPSAQPAAVAPATPTPAKPWNHPWAVQVGGGIVAALVVALIVFLLSR